jgi:hypothetical protein
MLQVESALRAIIIHYTVPQERASKDHRLRSLRSVYRGVQINYLIKLDIWHYDATTIHVAIDSLAPNNPNSSSIEPSQFYLTSDPLADANNRGASIEQCPRSETSKAAPNAVYCDIDEGAATLDFLNVYSSG